MRICILGTRGIPNNYGGFEQFAEYLSKGLGGYGHEVFVYSPHNHPYKGVVWGTANIIHIFDPEKYVGTIGQFIYDLLCISDSRRRKFDIILQLGYTSSSIWSFLLPKSSVIITNMDGLEWKRSKYSSLVKKFLLFAESLAVKSSRVLIADSIGIHDYLKAKYNADSIFIPYGAHVSRINSIEFIIRRGLEAGGYSMLIARLEPENNIETILEGVVLSKKQQPFIVVGNYQTKHGEYLRSKFKDEKRIIFIGSVYNIQELNSLRYYSWLYFHGHSVGGTNPSLLEAMASGALICANDNIFNRSILNDNALYFSSVADVAGILDHDCYLFRDEIVSKNFETIEELYNWDLIISQYNNAMTNSLLNTNNYI